MNKKGLDTILIVLTTVGLPAKDLSLLLTVDWLLYVVVFAIA
jgi:hypothetical protein